MKIIEKEREDYFRKISGMYRIDDINGINDVNKILKALEMSGARLEDISFVYEMDEADYRPTVTFQNYAHFLENGGLLTSLDSLEYIEFGFEMNNKFLSGKVGLHGNSIIIDTYRKLTDDPSVIFEAEEVYKQTENVIENIDAIVK